MPGGLMKSKNLYERLLSYGQSDAYPFHMPGHKRRMGEGLLGEIAGIDITEIDGFDNLHEAEGVLKEAQDFAARLCLSEETHFLVNGSSGGLLAAIAGVVRDGGQIGLSRNCHHSVYHAMELHHLKPYYIYPQMQDAFGIYDGIYPQDVEKMWVNGDNIQAIVITSPTYPGVISDISKICEIAHTHHVPVIVDEAHGAHLPFSDDFPNSAVACGADIVIQSTHKTLPALTQTALIHINGHLVDRDRIRRMLTCYQTSSPSYILMSSIDSCMHLMAEEGPSLFKAYLGRLLRLREEISRLKHIRLLSKKDLKYAADLDLSKLLIMADGMGGHELMELLRNRYHLECEMASPRAVLAMTTVADSDAGFHRLLEALREIDREMVSEKMMPMPAFPEPVQVMDLYEAGWMPKDVTASDRGEGKLSASYIYLYPPGVPLLTPGELVTGEALETIRSWLAAGFHVSGIRDVKDGQSFALETVRRQ